MVIAPNRTISRPTPTRKPGAARRKSRRNRPLLVWAGLEQPPAAVAAPFNPQKLQVFAQAVWRVCGHAHGMLVQRWLSSCGLHLPDDIGTNVLRFHSALKLHDDVRTPAAVFLLRDLHTDEPCGITRYFLDLDGKLIRRKTLGRVWSAAVKLSADENVCEGLHIATSIERGLAAMNSGLRPVWALTSANALAEFPVLNGIEALTIIAGRDDDTDATVERWRNAGRDVQIICTTESETPPPGEPDEGAIYCRSVQEVQR